MEYYYYYIIHNGGNKDPLYICKTFFILKNFENRKILLLPVPKCLGVVTVLGTKCSGFENYLDFEDFKVVFGKSVVFRHVQSHPKFTVKQNKFAMRTMLISDD